MPKANPTIPGQRFSRLVVEADLGNSTGRRKARCTCDCGKSVIVNVDNLRTGNTTSCGCFSLHMHRAINTRHGQASRNGKTKEYRAWKGMVNRATNPNATGAENYSVRGISLCPEWKASFEAFFSHIGPAPTNKHSVDRIDNDGNYEPGNVRWATSSQQNENRRRWVYKRNRNTQQANQ